MFEDSHQWRVSNSELSTVRPANTNCIVFCLTWLDLESTIFHTRGGHDNNYNTNAALFLTEILSIVDIVVCFKCKCFSSMYCHRGRCYDLNKR